MNATLPASMRAVEITAPGGPEVLRQTEVPRPSPRAGEVLIRVHAAGVNRPDVLQRLGNYPVPKDADPLPGLEVAGEVVACGPGATRWRPGDKLMALTHGGGYAEFCRVHEDHCLAIPAGLSMTEAAAIPETGFTVWYNLFMRAGLGSGESLLVHGGSSGIGSMAIQIAVARGAVVFVTAGSDEKCAFCIDLGAREAINYRAADWEAALKSLRGDAGVDVVLDMVAGGYMQKNMNLLARDGRYVIIAFLDGARATLDMRQLLTKRLTITGSTLRPQSTAEKAAIAASLQENVLPLVESGKVRSIVHATFPFCDAHKAHALMESSTHMGKIVLIP